MSNLIVSQINGGSIGVINAIINGNFAVNQRAVSGTVTLAAGAYGHDRWKAGASGCTYTFATANNITTLTISAGSLIQVIEGNNLFTGTYTLSWVGTAQGKIGGGSYASSGVTGTPAGGSNLNIEFNTGTVSLVQFEQGSVATPFERRPYSTELQLAQRYCFAKTTTDQQTGAGLWVSTTNVISNTTLPVTMRSAPTLTNNSATITCYAGGAGVGATTYILNTVGTTGYELYITFGSASGTAGQGTSTRVTAGSFILSAEL